MPNINNSYTWAVQTCNAPNIGYSQNYRNQQTVKGITYYDCSSFIWYALKAGGFDCKTANNGSNYPFTTATMRGVLQRLGFTSEDKNGIWLPGDIMWRGGHTEMVYQGGIAQGICMGAHTSNAKLVNQVSIGSSGGDATSLDYSSQWTELWRYGSGGSGTVGYEWIIGGHSEYFGDPSQPLCGNNASAMNNAACVYQFLYQRGWSLEAIAAVCGNMQQESTLNPGLIEIGGTGHGLVQWTPPEALYDVLDVLYGNHNDWEDGDKQMNALFAEYEQASGIHDYGIEKQWYETSEYPMSFEEFAHSTADPGYLSQVFVANYERPATSHPEREQYALWWYDYLKGIDPTGGGGTPTNPKKKMPVWMWIRYY